jgi:repressor LexA
VGAPHHKTKKRKSKKYYGLTKRQKDMLNVISKFIKKNKYSPSYEELKQLCGLRSKSGVHRYLNNLKERGYVMFKRNAKRNVMVL